MRSTAACNDHSSHPGRAIPPGAAGVQAYNITVEKLLTCAEAVHSAPIREQMDKMGKEVDRENTACSALEKGKRRDEMTSSLALGQNVPNLRAEPSGAMQFFTQYSCDRALGASSLPMLRYE